jgi:hypothetical protein
MPDTGAISGMILMLTRPADALLSTLQHTLLVPILLSQQGAAPTVTLVHAVVP